MTSTALQWGRDQLIAEMASMRRAVVDRSAASMGPRSADRGNFVDRPVTRVRGALQWGRDQLIAEMWRRAREVRHGHRGLQWGRDQLIAEMSPARRGMAA